MLFEILVEMNASQRQNFIQFVTGSKYLPVGGLGALKPKLIIAMNVDANQRLPSVMTCVNYLKLPMYASKEVLRETLLYAIADGRMSFDLT
jgi:E3 ubiquitin-protein ligase TRIP12